MEEIARVYLEELVDRNLVLVDKTGKCPSPYLVDASH